MSSTRNVRHIKKVRAEDFGGPQKPRSGFFIFCDRLRPEILKEQRQASTDAGGKFSVAQVAKILGDKWKNEVTEEEKNKLSAESDQEKANYKVQMEQWMLTEGYQLFKEQVEGRRQQQEAKALKQQMKDAGMPSRPQNAFMQFSKSVATDVCDALRSEDQAVTMLNRATESKKRWDALGEEERRKWSKKYKDDRLRYEEEMDIWEQTPAGQEQAARRATLAEEYAKKSREQLEYDLKRRECLEMGMPTRAHTAYFYFRQSTFGKEEAEMDALNEDAVDEDGLLNGGAGSSPSKGGRGARGGTTKAKQRAKEAREAWDMLKPDEQEVWRLKEKQEEEKYLDGLKLWGDTHPELHEELTELDKKATAVREKLRKATSAERIEQKKAEKAKRQEEEEIRSGVLGPRGTGYGKGAFGGVVQPPRARSGSIYSLNGAFDRRESRMQIEQIHRTTAEQMGRTDADPSAGLSKRSKNSRSASSSSSDARGGLGLDDDALEAGGKSGKKSLKRPRESLNFNMERGYRAGVNGLTGNGQWSKDQVLAGKSYKQAHGHFAGEQDGEDSASDDDVFEPDQASKRYR